MSAAKFWRGAAEVAYGALFVVGLPLFLVLFSSRVHIAVAIPKSPVVGVPVLAVGLVVMLWGMRDIWIRGTGLPMNAFPPPRLVTTGIYAVVPHPIYGGFVLACLGASLAFGSSSGALLTTPLVALAATALVLGHERPYLIRTFGELPRPLLGYSRLVQPIMRALRLDRMWATVLGITERLANSWSATRLGNARVINHALFAGLAGGVGGFVVVVAAGSKQVVAVWVMILAAIVGAALVGQLLVGSSNKLSRPFGYFGERWASWSPVCSWFHSTARCCWS